MQPTVMVRALDGRDLELRAEMSEVRGDRHRRLGVRFELVFSDCWV